MRTLAAFYSRRQVEVLLLWARDLCSYSRSAGVMFAKLKANIPNPAKQLGASGGNLTCAGIILPIDSSEEL